MLHSGTGVDGKPREMGSREKPEEGDLVGDPSRAHRRRRDLCDEGRRVPPPSRGSAVKGDSKLSSPPLLAQPLGSDH